MDDLQALLQPLVEQPATTPQPMTWFARRARRRTYRRRGLTAATAALLLALPLWVVSRRDTPSELHVTVGPSTTPTVTVTITTVPAGPFGPTAPWAGDPLPASAAPAFLEAAAEAPDVAAACPILALDDLGEGARAVPRMNPSGENDWRVEYDLAGAPGYPAEGAVPTADAGRATFAVGASLLPAPLRDLPPPWGNYDSLRDRINDRSHTHTWSDGSIAGWGDPEGPPLGPGAPVSDVVHFQLQDADPMCIYTVETFLGEAHALHLVAHLRRIDPAGG